MTIIKPNLDNLIGSGFPIGRLTKVYHRIKSTEQRQIIAGLRECWKIHHCGLLAHLNLYDDDVLIDPHYGACLKQCLSAYHRLSIE